MAAVFPRRASAPSFPVGGLNRMKTAPNSLAMTEVSDFGSHARCPANRQRDTGPCDTPFRRRDCGCDLTSPRQNRRNPVTSPRPHLLFAKMAETRHLGQVESHACRRLQHCCAAATDRGPHPATTIRTALANSSAAAIRSIFPAFGLDEWNILRSSSVFVLAPGGTTSPHLETIARTG